MVTKRGGFLNMHKDFNWHHKLQLWRKINCIIYLTKEWDPNWEVNFILVTLPNMIALTKKNCTFIQ